MGAFPVRIAGLQGWTCDSFRKFYESPYQFLVEDPRRLGLPEMLTAAHMKGQETRLSEKRSSPVSVQVVGSAERLSRSFSAVFESPEKSLQAQPGLPKRKDALQISGHSCGGVRPCIYPPVSFVCLILVSRPDPEGLFIHIPKDSKREMCGTGHPRHDSNVPGCVFFGWSLGSLLATSWWHPQQERSGNLQNHK